MWMLRFGFRGTVGGGRKGLSSMGMGMVCMDG